MAFTDVLAQIARTELDFWTTGNHRECLPELKPDDPRKHVGRLRVARYWQEGLNLNGLDGCTPKQPWSAAFICWCLERAEMALTEFPFSAGHHTFIRWAINNTKQNKPNKSYYGRRLTEHRPKPGDLIAQWRKEKETDPDPNITFDLQPDQRYPAHTDIVVKVTASEITTIGGNLGNRVRETKFAATGGMLALKKELICVLECRKQ